LRAAALAGRRTADEPDLGEVLEFMRVIWSVDHALQMASKRMASTLGVTGPQRLVLRIVGRFPGIPAGHLARVLHLHPSTLTGIIRRMSKRGLIRRRGDPRDGRRLLLSLTRAGRRFDVSQAGTIEAGIERALGRASRVKIGAALEVLVAVREALG
jgi:DNA-binding MarR family transcriptional regulator